MRIIGIDENGLGPLLGPLVVTAVAFDAPAYDAPAFWEAGRAFARADDSKRIFSSKKMANAERATLSWLEAFGVDGNTWPALARDLFLPPTGLPCGAQAPVWCAPSRRALPVWSAETEPLAPQPLLDAGIQPIRAAAIGICPGVFNRETQAGTNKFHLDFLSMLRLARHLGSDANGEALVLCGKIGSMRRYGPWLGSAFDGLWSTTRETREESEYELATLGALRFTKDSDGLHLPVAVASMIGKYLRELSMLDINERLAPAGARHASGYRDPVTASFVTATAKARAELGIPDACFLRTS